MKRFISKYRHGLVIAVYSIIYILLFSYLEHRPVHSYHIVHTVFDDWIPFCEFFIVPYMLWFPYMILAVIYFIFFNKNKHEYYQLAFNLMMGMTVFLCLSKCSTHTSDRISKRQYLHKYSKMAVQYRYSYEYPAQHSCVQLSCNTYVAYKLRNTAK